MWTALSHPPPTSSTPSTVHYYENNVMCAVTNKTLESQSRLNELLTDDNEDFANDFIFTLSRARIIFSSNEFSSAFGSAELFGSFLFSLSMVV